MRGEIYLARKYLKPQLTLISILTYLSFLGPILGVSILIFVSSIMNGFPKKIIDTIKEVTPSIIIKKNKSAFRYSSEIKKLKKDFNLIASPTGKTLSFVQPANNNRKIRGFALKGFLPKKDTSSLKNHIVKGTYNISDKQVLISSNVAEEENLKIGDKIFVHSPLRYTKLIKKMNKSENNINEITLDLAKELEIVGFFNFNYAEYDYNYIFIHLDTFNELNSLRWSQASNLEIWLKNPEESENILPKLRSDPYWGKFNYSSWKDQHRGFVQLVENEKFMVFFALSFIMLAATIGIAVSILSFILKKLREIGILKALGVSSHSITLLFFIQGAFLGTISTTIGLGLGLAMVEGRQYLLNIFQTIIGRELLPKHTYGVDGLPAYINETEIAYIYIGCVILCILTSIIPSLIASRVKPHTVLQTGV